MVSNLDSEPLKRKGSTMNRKEFFKKACGMGLCSCIGLGVLSKCGVSETVKEPEKENDPVDETTAVVPADARQIQNLLTFVESSLDDAVSKSIFEQLGAEHLTDPGFVGYINESKKNIKGYFDYINSGKDTYWEKIAYDSASSTIKITGKPVDKCACAYAQFENPPLSLCRTCCTNFQKCLFQMLLEKTVTKVQVDAAYLLGGNRCSTTLYIDGKIEM